MHKELSEIKGKLSAVTSSSYLLLDAINSMLIERGYSICYSAEDEPSPVIIEAIEKRKIAKAHGKQRKDNMHRKNMY